MLIILSSDLVNLHKKSGTALLLFRYSRPWNCLSPEQATPKPTPICTITHTYLWRAWIWIYISRGHQNAAMCWVI